MSRFVLGYITGLIVGVLIAVHSTSDAKAATIVPINWNTSWASAYDDPQPLACFNLHLNNHMMGVAHKTLPCGTHLTMRYHGRIVHVQVLDRGPYIAHRDFDLMPAVYHRFGFRTANDWGVRRVRWTRGWK